MNIKNVPVSRGWDWISEGFGLFRQDPLIWVANLLIFFAILTLLSLIPFLGGIAAMLLQPVLVGGMLLGCRAQTRGESLRVDHLFEGFKLHAQPLLLVGLLSGLAYLVVVLVVALVAGGSAVGLMLLGGEQDLPTPAVGGAMLGFLLSGLIGLGLSVPVAMAAWFAPALVVFDNLAAVDAMKTSFFGCLRNMLPFLLYGIAALLLMVLASIPLGLGLLVLGPTLAASVYIGYMDIFQA